MGFPRKTLNLYFTLFIELLYASTAICAVERPRGVAISKASLYVAGAEFACLDGTSKISFDRVNDDYCDCLDGSDEPGTSACTNGNFHCTNAGHKPMYIPSSRVNDGICDCCDGTDEYVASGACQNTCKEMGRAAREEADRQQVLMKEGFQIYQEYTKQGFQALKDKEVRLQELQKQKDEFNEKREELRRAKDAAEAPEREAKDAHKQIWEEEKAKREAVNDKEAATRAFDDLDTDNDHLVTVEEIRAHPEFDIDTNGDVTEEEAKEYLEDRDAVTCDMFEADIWPNIKAIYKPTVVSHIPRDEEAGAGARGEEEQAEEPVAVTDEPPYEDVGDGPDPDEYYDDEYDEEDDYYEDDEDSEEIDMDDDEPASNEMPEYDDATKLLIAEADKARGAYNEADNDYKDLEKELNDINKFLSMDLGDEKEFFPLKDNCYEYTDREYTYKLCPYEKASQRSKTGGSETSLGKWGRWDGPEDNQYSVMFYENGQGCWNGPNRSVKVHIKCGTSNAVVAVSETERCVYEFQFTTPAACSSYQPAQHLDSDHDEL